VLLNAIDAAIRDRWGLQNTPEVTGLEISVDFRPRLPSDQLLAQMFAVLVRSHSPSRDVISNPRDRPRFVYGTAAGEKKTSHVLAHSRGKPERNDELLLRNDKDRPPTVGSTYYAGEEGSRCAWRVMTKVLDQQNPAAGTRVELPEEHHRVRIEVTLDQAELKAIGVANVSDLVAFRFQTFQGRYFSFRLPTFADPGKIAEQEKITTVWLESERRTKFLNAGVLGLKAMDEARRRQHRMARKAIRQNLQRALGPTKRLGTSKEGTFVCYEELTRQVIHALRHLGKRFQSSG
jgi:hypothetical protein